MADEELHKTTSTAPTDSAESTETTARATSEEVHDEDILADGVEDGVEKEEPAGDDAEGDVDTETDADAGDDEADDDEYYGVALDKVEALLNANVDKDSLTPQMRRVMQRQEEDSKRVEETIKGTKANPGWFVPLFCVLMIIGLVWAVTFYITSKYPIPAIGQWNLAVAFAIIMVGFLMTMGWR